MEVVRLISDICKSLAKLCN